MSETNPDREALARATAQMRRMTSHLRKTRAPRASLEKVEEALAALAAELAPFDHPGPYAQAGLEVSLLRPGQQIDQGLKPAELFPYSPIIGPLNPVAPPVLFEKLERELRAEHVFDAPYVGPPGSVHGGVIALAFDELLGSLGALSGVGGFTGTLTIVYRSLTPVGHPIRMRSWIDRTEGVKTFIKGTMHCDFPKENILCAEAEGIFIQPRRSIVEDALTRTA
jgi:acyl-coenzyme A thioesterase PaaI-like protein